MDQNFIELEATGNFNDYDSIMLGFTNPLVGDPTDGTGMSSIFNAAWITEESRTEKF